MKGVINIEIGRYGFGLDSTLGRIYCEGGPWDVRTFMGFSLEDQVRPEGAPKVRGETAIPAKTYNLTLRTEGGMHADYLDRFPEWHKGMLWLREVPNFDWIYIHPLNTDKHSLGCIGPGTVPLIMPDGEFQIRRSVDAYKPLYIPIADHLLAGGKAAVHIYNMREVL